MKESMSTPNVDPDKKTIKSACISEQPSLLPEPVKRPKRKKTEFHPPGFSVKKKPKTDLCVTIKLEDGDVCHCHDK